MIQGLLSSVPQGFSLGFFKSLILIKVCCIHSALCVKLFCNSAVRFPFLQASKCHRLSLCVCVL